MRKLKIACIGTRNETGEHKDLFRIGAYLAKLKIHIVSGNATGSDFHFANGANSIDPSFVKLYLPWANYNEPQIVAGNTVISEIDPRYINSLTVLAAKHHPRWNSLTDGAKRLMVRNAAIIDEADAVIANPGRTSFGTQHGMSIAASLGIPIMNLVKTKDVKNDFLRFMKDLLSQRD